MNFFYIHKARFCYFVGVTFGFFLQNSWFFCLFVCFLSSLFIFIGGLFPPFVISQGLK